MLGGRVCQNEVEEWRDEDPTPNRAGMSEPCTAAILPRPPTHGPKFSIIMGANWVIWQNCTAKRMGAGEDGCAKAQPQRLSRRGGRSRCMERGLAWRTLRGSTKHRLAGGVGSCLASRCGIMSMCRPWHGMAWHGMAWHGMAGQSERPYLHGQQALEVPAQAVADLECNLAGGVQLRAEGVAHGRCEWQGGEVRAGVASMHQGQMHASTHMTTRAPNKTEHDDNKATTQHTSLRLVCISGPISLFSSA